MDGEYEPEPELNRNAGHMHRTGTESKATPAQGRWEHMCRCEHWSNLEIKASRGTPDGHEMTCAQALEICALSRSYKTATRHKNITLGFNKP